MGEEKCRDCPYVKSLENRVGKVEGTLENLEKDVTDIKVKSGERKQQMITLFNQNKQINSNILDIKKTVENFKENSTFKNLIRDIVKGASIAIIVAFLLQAFKVFHW